MMLLKDWSGLDNGFFKVLNYSGVIKYKGTRTWNCECRCGKIVLMETSELNRGIPKSCGCHKQRRPGNKFKHDYHITHGLSRGNKRHTLIYMWKNMKTRCYNASSKDFSAYQGNGITVCDEWKNNSLSFINWALTNGWKSGLTIDRIDPKKGYFPENCQFITMSENSKKVFKDNPTLKRGMNHRDAKLTDQDVIEIRRLISLGKGNTEIAKKYTILPNVIYQIKTGKTWKHVK